MIQPKLYSDLEESTMYQNSDFSIDIDGERNYVCVCITSRITLVVFNRQFRAKIQLT